MNRKGDWIQIFLVMFFVLLLIVGLALLFVEKDKLKIVRPENTNDFLSSRTDTILLSLLRQPAMVDMNGDGTKEQVTFATLLVKGVTQEQLTEELKQRLPNAAAYTMTVTRGSETITVDHVKRDSVLRSIFSFGMGRSMNELVFNGVKETSLILPQQTTITFFYADWNSLFIMFDYPRSKGQHENINEYVQEIEEAFP